VALWELPDHTLLSVFVLFAAAAKKKVAYSYNVNFLFEFLIQNNIKTVGELRKAPRSIRKTDDIQAEIISPLIGSNLDYWLNKNDVKIKALPSTQECILVYEIQDSKNKYINSQSIIRYRLRKNINLTFKM